MKHAADATHILPITLTRAEWRALIVAASLTETIHRHPNVLVAEVGIGGDTPLHVLLDTARSTIAFVLRERPHVDETQLRQRIKIALDRHELPPTPRRRRMSKAARKAVSARMRKYWATRRKKGGAK